MASGFLLAQSLPAAENRNVLVLYSNNRLVPGNVAIDRGLRAEISSPIDRPVQIFSEFLDRPDFGGDAYEGTVTTYLREKYAARPPSAIVAVSDGAFDFLLRHRARLFPEVPLVHAAVSQAFLRSFQPLPADVVGVPLEYDFSGTIAQALRWHPKANRLLIVTGASERDREWEVRLRREVPAVAGNVAVEFLARQPTPLVLQRLSALGANDLVFTPGYFADGDGRLFNPRDAAKTMASAATAPVYGPFDTFIGTGIVGGRMPNFEATGRQGAQVVNELFAGAAPASLQLPAIAPTALQVDWREIRRWRIDETKIPPDTVTSFRDPSLWETYRGALIITAAVILLQAALIVTLLLERARRRTAEFLVQKQRSELAHASRLAVAGELTASIAHEINQPLGAILASADAADLLLQSTDDRRDDVRRIVTRIRRDDLRASDVISRLRKLFAKHEPEQRGFDLNTAAIDVVALLQAEARQRRTTLEARTSSMQANVVGDVIQIQQVLINLVLNALDALSDVPDDRRAIIVSVARAHGGMTVTVRDQGHGIAPEHLQKVFESFFSTKQKGMGLGLSIARTIVDAHRGRIWAENGQDGGAAFHVELPAADEARTVASVPS